MQMDTMQLLCMASMLPDPCRSLTRTCTVAPSPTFSLALFPCQVVDTGLNETSCFFADGDGKTIQHGHYFQDVGTTNPRFTSSSDVSWSRFRTVEDGGDFTHFPDRRKVRPPTPPKACNPIWCRVAHSSHFLSQRSSGFDILEMISGSLRVHDTECMLFTIQWYGGLCSSRLFLATKRIWCVYGCRVDDVPPPLVLTRLLFRTHPRSSCPRSSCRPFLFFSRTDANMHRSSSTLNSPTTTLAVKAVTHPVPVSQAKGCGTRSCPPRVSLLTMKLATART